MTSPRGVLARATFMLLGLSAVPTGAQTADLETSGVDEVPALRPPVADAMQGRRIVRIEVVTEGGRWEDKPTLRRVRIGDALTPEVSRRAMSELTDSGRYAAVRAEVEAEAGGVVLRLVVEPRRVAATVKIVGGIFDENDTLRAAGVRAGGEVTSRGLSDIGRRTQRFYSRRGYPRARVRVDAIDTDNPMEVVVIIDVTSGEPRRVADRVFRVDPPPGPKLRAMLNRYEVRPGDRADQEVLTLADDEFRKLLQVSGWHRARVSHELLSADGGAKLEVHVWSGPLLRPRFEGNRHFDSDELRGALDLVESEDRSAATLADRVRAFYVARGFLDVEVDVEERGGPSDPIHDLVFKIRANQRVRVVGREFSCLAVPKDSEGTTAQTPNDVGAEIDGFISEDLPGSDIVGAVDPALVDSTFGPKHPTGARPAPLALNPYNTYVPDLYERALKHVQDLYRSEGYLSATVGPVAMLRRACDRRSPPGQCKPIGQRVRPKTSCRYDAVGLPVEEPPFDQTQTCKPDPAKGVTCEPEVVLHIPIKLGPRSYLYDVAFEGNREIVEKVLEDEADLELGAPVSQVELDKARRRVLDAYAEEGFAFAEVEVLLDLSPDRTRARARFIISERERVLVASIEIRGNRRTREGVIRRRVALTEGEPYRRSDVRKTEERLATLGVFSSVTVGLEDPYIPAKEKVVVITVAERPAQHLDVRPGFSTGEGLRVTFEYGHRNIAGSAIQVTLRVQLSYLPDIFILEQDVRENFQKLPLSKRIERRNTASIEFPEIGLGPLFRFGVDGVDVRDNARDFGLTKDAGIVTLTYRPNTRFSSQIGGSLELNDAEIFSGESLDQFLLANPSPSLSRLLRVPDGKTFAVAQRTGFTWDRRDNPFGATRGTLFAAGVEHVRAFPSDDNPNTITSDFLRFTNRVAGYIRLSKKGLALAASFRWGFNQQLIADSATYPDRLFFLGGVDTLRGFLQDSVVPEDVAEQILDPNTPLTVDDVAIRGGDVSINPRAELRVPLGGIVSTALFVDAGNLWVEPDNVEPLKLRYAAGSGLRAGTPIGPLAFDYGINLDRRPWEDFGAFHFSIGLF